MSMKMEGRKAKSGQKDTGAGKRTEERRNKQGKGNNVMIKDL